MVTKDEIKNSFKNKELHKVIDVICENVENFEYSKGGTDYSEGYVYSINVWQISPLNDEGSFLYYNNETDRDSDFDLLCGIVEGRQL